MTASPMNAQLLQLLGTRLGLSDTESVALRTGDYARFFGERLAADPSLAGDPLVAMLMSGISGGGADLADADDDLEPAAAVDDDTRLLAGRALSALRSIAAILGACHCWGQDAGCIDCEGLGAPGFRGSSDPRTLLLWVRPTLRRMGLRLVRATATTSEPPTQPRSD